MSQTLLQELCDTAQSLFNRGYAFGSTGNLSVKIGDGIWITPTGVPLRGLKPAKIACIDLNGKHLNTHRPSKEYPFHLGIYRRRPDCNAIVHLHSPHAVALSCLEDLDASTIPAITPYYFMRVAPLGIVPYFRPGSAELAAAVEEAAPRHNCLLLRNHGLIAAGSSWSEAVDRAEELEQTARLYFLTRGQRLRLLSEAELAEIGEAFPAARSISSSHSQL
jgi:ribulose-5-phosphate 4-epimerase/fuculose-1-phosphate aldolase